MALPSQPLIRRLFPSPRVCQPQIRSLPRTAILRPWKVADSQDQARRRRCPPRPHRRYTALQKLPVSRRACAHSRGLHGGSSTQTHCSEQAQSSPWQSFKRMTPVGEKDIAIVAGQVVSSFTRPNYPYEIGNQRTPVRAAPPRRLRRPCSHSRTRRRIGGAMRSCCARPLRGVGQ